MNLTESIQHSNGWYWNEDVLRVILQFWGADIEKIALESFATANTNGLRHLSDSTIIKNILKTVKNEYVVVVGKQILEETEQVSKSVKIEELPYYINFENPCLEYFQSFWQKDAINYADQDDKDVKPIRSIFVLDVEYYNKHEQGNIIIHQKERFLDLEPTYKVIKDKLNEYGIKHITVMTGKGYHFISQVPHTSPIMEQIIKIGSSIESSLRDKQRQGRFLRRERPVPPNVELIFKGNNRLQQFFFCQVINEIRRKSNIRIEISDCSEEGIALDNTILTRQVDMSCFGSLGSLYLKTLLAWDKIGGHIVSNTPIPVRILRSINDIEILSLEDAILIRNDYDLALKHLASIEGFIPDGTNGLEKLIADYWDSALYNNVHKMMDSEEHDPPESWNMSYRNYDGICAKYPSIVQLLRNPNPSLLSPDELNYFINELYFLWEVDKDLRRMKHISGLLRAIYEDGIFNWGNSFLFYDAARHANGWVELVLGQKYEK